jgi:hypothetical protein
MENRNEKKFIKNIAIIWLIIIQSIFTVWNELTKKRVDVYLRWLKDKTMVSNRRI